MLWFIHLFDLSMFKFSVHFKTGLINSGQRVTQAPWRLEFIMTWIKMGKIVGFIVKWIFMDTTEKIHSDFAGYMSPAFPGSGVHAGKPTPFPMYAGKPHPLPIPSACWEANPLPFTVHAGKPTPLPLLSACWEANPLLLPSACWEANPFPLPNACWEARPPSQCMLGSQPPTCLMHFLILTTAKWALIEVTLLAIFLPSKHCLHAWRFHEYGISWVYHAAGMTGIESSGIENSGIESVYICNFLWDFTAKTTDISTRSPTTL